ncbi:MAG TPA: hypothetical protein VMD52_04215 [Patescibacteria group bacterium]|nr:hypothetical protein [Patescibacteria group bacterium]
MRERRRAVFWLRRHTFKFVHFALVYIAVLVVVNFYSAWKMVSELQTNFQYSSAWKTNFLIMQVSFLGVIFILLASTCVLLHRSLGPLQRIESMLDEVLAGNYSVRITIRKKDLVHSLVDKINRIIGLLERRP